MSYRYVDTRKKKLVNYNTPMAFRVQANSIITAYTALGRVTLATLITCAPIICPLECTLTSNHIYSSLRSYTFSHFPDLFGFGGGVGCAFIVCFVLFQFWRWTCTCLLPSLSLSESPNPIFKILKGCFLPSGRLPWLCEMDAWAASDDSSSHSIG